MRTARNVIDLLPREPAASLGPIEDKNVELARRRVVGVTHLELRRADLLDAIRAEAHERIRRALVDDEMKVADRPRPIGAGGEDVGNAPLVERARGKAGLVRLR